MEVKAFRDRCSSDQVEPLWGSLFMSSVLKSSKIKTIIRKVSPKILTDVVAAAFFWGY